MTDLPSDDNNSVINHFSETDIEKMALAIHMVWQKNKLAEYKKKQKIPPTDVLREYDLLSEDEKDQNRANARNIINQLHAIGLNVALRSTSCSSVMISKDKFELLAIREHQRWVKNHLENGWRYAEITEKNKKLHSDLVPWDLEELDHLSKIYGPGANEKMGRSILSEQSRQYDREIVQAYPAILEQAGFKIISVR